jgi:hypothetical protein
MADNYFDIRKPSVMDIAEQERNPGGFVQTVLKGIEQQINEEATAQVAQKVKEFEQELLAKKDIAVLGIMRDIRIEVNDHSIDGRTINIKIHYQE